MGLIDLEPDPERYKPKLDRSGSGDRSIGWLIWEALAGVGGYIGLAMACMSLGKLMGVHVGSWAMVPLISVPPLLVVGGAGYYFKSKAMLLGAVIPFGVLLLSCGLCAALASKVG